MSQTPIQRRQGSRVTSPLRKSYESGDFSDMPEYVRTQRVRLVRGRDGINEHKSLVAPNSITSSEVGISCLVSLIYGMHFQRGEIVSSGVGTKMLTVMILLMNSSFVVMVQTDQ